MKIVHYLFGLPPVRTGGVPKYALDLMSEQKQIGEEVVMLVPGSIKYAKRNSVKIKYWKVWNHIPCYQIINPQFIPNGFGIKKPEAFMQQCNPEVFKKWLKKLAPDVIHIHSIMGLHLEFFVAAKMQHIKVVYTTHDYFGLCPKIDLLKDGAHCKAVNWEECQSCCKNAYTLKRLWFEQTNIYRQYCNSSLMRHLVHCNFLQKARDFLKYVRQHNNTGCNGYVENDVNLFRLYLELEQYYLKIFCLIDSYHFNSQQSKEIFEEKLGAVKGKVIPITNKSIFDQRSKRTYHGTLKIGFLGNSMPFKGSQFLINVLYQLYKSGRTDLCLNTYMSNGKNDLFIKNHEPYSSEEMPIVFKDMDVLVVPSLCKETFGMVVLEALSYGVPVLVSEYVGAKMLIEANPGIGIIFPLNKNKLLQIITDLYDDRKVLSQMNFSILNSNLSFDYKEHVDVICKFYAE